MTGQVGGINTTAFHLVPPEGKPKAFQFGKSRVTLKRGSQDSVVLHGKVVEGGKKLSSTDQKKYALMVLKDGNMGKVTKVAIHIDDAAKSLYGSDREIKNNPTLQKEKASFKQLAHKLNAAENHVQETLKAREKIQAQFEGSAFDKQLKELDEQGFDDREISTLLQGTDAEAATVLKEIGEEKLERAKELREQGKELRASFKEYEAALNQYEDASQMLQNIIGNAAQVRIFATQTFTSRSSVEAEVSKLMRKVADFTGDSVQGKKDELKRLSEEAEDPEVRAAAEKLLASMDWLTNKIAEIKSKLDPKLENWPQHQESASEQLHQLRRFADDGIRDIQSREIELAKTQATPELAGTALKEGLELMQKVTDKDNKALSHLQPGEKPTEGKMDETEKALKKLATETNNQEVQDLLQRAEGKSPSMRKALYLTAFAALTIGTYALMRYSGVSVSDILSDPKGSFTIFTTAAGQALGGAYNWAFGSQKMSENLIDFANRTPTTLVKASQEGIAQAGQRLADFINGTPVASVMDNLAEFPKAAAKKTLDLATQSPNPILGNMAEIPENAASIGLGIGLLSSLRDQGASAFNKLGSYLPELKMPDVSGTISSLKSRVFGGAGAFRAEADKTGGTYAEHEEVDESELSAEDRADLEVYKEVDRQDDAHAQRLKDSKIISRPSGPPREPISRVRAKVPTKVQDGTPPPPTAQGAAIKGSKGPSKSPTPAAPRPPTAPSSTVKGSQGGPSKSPTPSAPRTPTAQQVSTRGFDGKSYPEDEPQKPLGQSRPEDAPKGPSVTKSPSKAPSFAEKPAKPPSSSKVPSFAGKPGATPTPAPSLGEGGELVFPEITWSLLNGQFVNQSTLTDFMKSGDFDVKMTPEELLKMLNTVSGALKDGELGSDLVEEGQTVQQLLDNIASSGKEGANALLKSAQSLSKEDILKYIEPYLRKEGAKEWTAKQEAVGAAAVIAFVTMLNFRAELFQNKLENPLLREFNRLNRNAFALGAKERKEHIAWLEKLEKSKDLGVPEAAKKFRDYSETYFVKIDEYKKAIEKGLKNAKDLPAAQKALTHWQRMEQKDLWNKYGNELTDALNAANPPKFSDPKVTLTAIPQKKAASAGQAAAEEKKVAAPDAGVPGAAAGKSAVNDGGGAPGAAPAAPPAGPSAAEIATNKAKLNEVNNRIKSYTSGRPTKKGKRRDTYDALLKDRTDLMTKLGMKPPGA